ncbi:MAG: arginase [Pseudomonadota bacterium]
MEQPIKAEIIGYDSGWGGRDYLCEDGPAAVPADHILHKLRYQGIETKWRGTLGIKFLGKHDLLNTKEKTLPLVAEGLKRLSNHVKLSIRNGYIPVVIGGDHASAIGTWSGAVAALRSPGKFGLLWLDAHMDAHTYETSRHGKCGGWWHGQPLSALIGHGLPELRNIGGAAVKLDPQHISLIGVHSFESEEDAFVKRHNIRVYHFEEVIRRGFKAVFLEALERATNGTAGFGLSIDLDFFDPFEAPGVGTPEDKGMSAAEVLPIIRAVARNPLFKALEIAEFNPHKDKDDKTRILVEKIIENVFSRPADEVAEKS